VAKVEKVLAYQREADRRANAHRCVEHHLSMARCRRWRRSMEPTSATTTTPSSYRDGGSNIGTVDATLGRRRNGDHAKQLAYEFFCLTGTFLC
jgi:hypothetical protein